MNPNNNLNQNNPGSPYPQRPQQRPMNDFGPRRPMAPQRPFNDFAPKPGAQRPQQNARPQSAMPTMQQRPMGGANASAARPYRQPQPQAQSNQQPNSNTAQDHTPLTFNPPKSSRKKAKRVFAFAAVAVLLVAGSFLLFNTQRSKDQPVVTAQNSQPSIKPLEKPEFTTYYPNPMPAGLVTTKGTISYYKDSFTFIVEQNGQKNFFIYEQPASSDPDFNSLKTKLAAPKGIALTVGQGIEGGLDNGTVTAVKTDKNTIIIINCVKTVCSTAPRDILSSMQLVSDLDSLRRSN
jgi:hypothetical protein